MTEEKKRRHTKGRPPIIDNELINKLDNAFMMGCSDREACLYAGISTTTLYKYLKDHPEYADRRALLKETPAIKARRTLIHSIEKGDDVSARWYLERRRPEEFGSRSEISVTAAGSLSIKDRSEALSAFLSRFEGESDK